MTETFTDELVTYTLEVEGRLVVVENVPARVCQETGEQLFAPDTVEHVYQLVWGQAPPKRIVQTPVYEYA
jgi:YgiT-type zinc finger domain-containing protein